MLELWIGANAALYFSCTRSSSRLNVGHVPIYNNVKFAPAGHLRHPRRDVTYIAFYCVLMGKVCYDIKLLGGNQMTLCMKHSKFTKFNVPASHLWTDKDFEIVVVGHCLMKLSRSMGIYLELHDITTHDKALFSVFTLGKVLGTRLHKFAAAF